MRNLIVTLLLIFISVESLGQYGPYYQRPTPTLSSTADVLIGSITTSASRKRSDFWFVVGWGFIIFGTISSASRTLRNILFANETQIQMFSGKDHPEHLEASVANGDLIQKIEMDSTLAASNPELVKDLPMGEVLAQSQLDSQRIGNLIISAKKVGDDLLDGREFGTHLVLFNSQAARTAFGPLSLREKHIIKNYLRLRNIIITQ